jgi:cytochrome oxidase assembly protein ShyY1
LDDPYEDKEAVKQRRFWTTLVVLVGLAAAVSWWLGTWPFKPKMPDDKAVPAATAR